MKGGFNNPPNRKPNADQNAYSVASMKGGFNNPPNAEVPPGLRRPVRASMKGGFNNPPNMTADAVRVTVRDTLQ